MPCQREIPRPVAFLPHFPIGLALSECNFTAPDGTYTVPSGARHAHFEGFFHGVTSEKEVNEMDGYFMIMKQK